MATSSPLRITFAAVAFVSSILAGNAARAADGDLDTTFGSGGAVGVDIIPQAQNLDQSAVAVVALADGKSLVLVALSGGLTTTYAGIVRLNADGTLDATFGIGGKASVQVPGNPVYPTDLLLAMDGKIIVGGMLFGLQSPFLARLEANGATDSSFGTAGIVSNPAMYATLPPQFAMQPDGKLVIFSQRLTGVGATTELAFVRYEANGSPDLSFGTSGIAATGISGLNTAPKDLALQADGAIVATFVRNPSNPFTRAVLRVTATGALDASFNGNGRLDIPFASATFPEGTNLAVLAGGNILVTGATSNLTAIGLARIRPDGTFDPAFGTAGTAVVPGGLYGETLEALAVFPGGRIATAGTSAKFTPATRAGIARFMPDGRLDTNFRGTGRLNEGTLLSGASHVAIQPDGKVIVAGWRIYTPNRRTAVVMRLEAPAPSSALAGSSATSVNEGGPVDLTAYVYGISPTGTVTFRRAGVDVPGCVAVPLTAGIATCAGQVLPAGVHAITVEYSGDGDDPPAVSPPYLQYVLSAGGDVDNDGAPDFVEIAEATDPTVKDNDVFAANAKGARLFALQQYRDFFGREGDASGVNTWANAIESGAWTRVQVIDAFLSSPGFEGLVAPLVRLYFAAFLRVPDYLGLAANIAQVQSGGLTVVQVADFFAQSPEFIATYGSLNDTQFVTLLYNNVLGRAPDTPGLNGWLALMQSGYTRGQVLLGFSDSTEYQAALANEVFVTMMYTGMLHRTPEPNGFNGWLAFLDGGTYTRAQVINGFMLSVEYRARFLP